MAPRKKRKMDALAPSIPEDPSKANSETHSHNNSSAQPPKKRKSAPKEASATTRRHTRGMTTDAARKAVFNTSELLEYILVCLPPKTLFGVQRVSKQFQAVVATSVPIQEKMFLRVRNEPQVSWLLKEQFTPYGAIGYFVESANDPPDRNSRVPTNLNPFLTNRSKSACAERVRGNVAEQVRLKFDQPVSLTMLREGVPSILKTYISDPPSEDIKLVYNYQFPESRSMRVHQDKVEDVPHSGTVGNAIRNAMEGHGRACLDHGLKSLDFDRQADCRGEAVHPHLVVEHYEKVIDPTAESKSGIRIVDFSIRDMVIPTDDERAAVKSRDKEG